MYFGDVHASFKFAFKILFVSHMAAIANQFCNNFRWIFWKMYMYNKKQLAVYVYMLIPLNKRMLMEKEYQSYFVLKYILFYSSKIEQLISYLIQFRGKIACLRVEFWFAWLMQNVYLILCTVQFPTLLYKYYCKFQIEIVDTEKIQCLC